MLAVAAAASCWNLLGAPFAALTALSALVVALRRLRGAGPARARLVLAAGLAGAALLVSVLVVVAALAAVDPATVLTGAPHPAAAEAERTLDDAERDTASRREAARRELQRLGSPREAIPDAQR